MMSKMKYVIDENIEQERANYGTLGHTFAHRERSLPTKHPAKTEQNFHEHLTRSHLKLHITRTNHRFAERCIRNSIPLLVNTMPMELINKISTHSLQNVARRIKEYYLSSYKERCDILNCYVCQN